MRLKLVERRGVSWGNDDGGHEDKGAQSIHNGASLPITRVLVTGPK